MPQLDSKIEPTKELGKEDILEILSAEEEDEKIDLKEEEKDEVKEEEEEEEEKEEKDELDEIEKELELEEEPKEDDLELVTPVRRKEILAKYPKIFKDFPYLEKAYYREQKFTELYPTIEDANTAKEKSETLDNFEEKLLSGDLTDILQATKNENKEAFNKLADNYLLSLSKVDENAYHHVIGNITRSIITHMVREANSLGDKDGAVLKNAAQIINQFVFGTSQFSRGEPLSKQDTEKSDKEKELEQREESFRKERFESARDGLDKRIGNALKNTISINIDKNESMTSYVKKNAEREALEEVYNLLEKDSRFKALKDKLWENAFKKNFDRDSMDKIESLIKTKAKVLLPSVIKKARYEALKGMGKRVREESDESESERVPTKRESAAPQKSRQTIKKGDIPSNMSSKDYIMGQGD